MVTYTGVDITTLIVTVRCQRVILDRDLAALYGVPTFRFNEAVKRNRSRFPEDFMFQLTREEVASLTSQFAMSKSGRGGRRTLPYAFTEHGTVMAANILTSPKAIQMSVFAVRAFIRLREMVSTHRELSRRLAELEKRLESHDEQIQLILKAIKPLMAPPEKTPKKIGFQLKEKRASYSPRG